MRISVLITGALLFFIGAFTKTKLFLALGIITIILSFFWKKKKKNKENSQIRKASTKLSHKCPSCGAELLPDDNYCPECGKKVLP